MKVDLEKMYMQLLKSVFLISNFLKGIEKYSYEDYLLEYVNQSVFFRDKANGDMYKHPVKEPHGENDCISPSYQLDFKLLLSQSMLQSVSLFSSQYTIEKGSVVVESCSRMRPSNPKYRPICATDIQAALRGKTVSTLNKIRNQNKGLTRAEQEVQHLLEVLETDKNILLLFPYNFFFKESVELEEGLKIAIKGIEWDFKEAMRYRNQVKPHQDTFLCFFYKRHIVILQWKEDYFQFIEKLQIESSPTFMRLLSSVDDPLSGGDLR